YGTGGTPILLINGCFGAGGEFGVTFFAEKRFGGLDELVLTEQPLGKIVAGFNQDRQWIVRLRRNQIGDPFFGPLGGDSVWQRSGFEHFIDGVEDFQNFALDGIGTLLVFLPPALDVEV